MLRAGARRPRALDLGLGAACLALLGFAVLYPVGRMLVAAVATWQMQALRDGLLAVWNTLLISLATVVCCAVFGTALAFLFTRVRFPGRGLLAGLAYLPFTLPPLVGVLSFYYLISEDGYLVRGLEAAFGVPVPPVSGGLAILIIHTYAFYIFFYAMVSSALATLDRAQLEAARTLGAGPWRTFSRVTLPQLRPALLGASLLCFMSSGASFSAPYFFGEAVAGQRFPVLSTEIYSLRAQYKPDEALTLTVVLAALSLLGLLFFRARTRTASGGSKGAPMPLRSGAATGLVTVLAWLLMAVLLLPHLNIVYLSFVDHRAWQTEVFPLAFTLENYANAFGAWSALRPVMNSIWMSALATVAALVVALPAGYLIGRARPGGGLMNVLVMLPWALPGTVVAIMLVAAFNDDWLRLHTTIWLLPLAYFVRNVPLLVRVASAAIEPFDGSLLEAARTLGASRAYALRRIVLPLLAPALAAGSALVFATSLGEFVASILIAVPNNTPISVHINEAWRSTAGVGAAFAYSVLLMLLLVATFVVARRFSSRLF